jgi:hypothetical protein
MMSTEFGQLNWQLRIALGACLGARLLSLAALLLGGFGLYLQTISASPSLLNTLVVVAVLPALYLGLRMEIDRVLFQRLADQADGMSLATLDAALLAQGLIRPGASTRSLTERANGVFTLLRWLGALLVLQFSLLLLASWLR